MKNSNLKIREIGKESQVKGQKNILKNIMVKNFPNFN